MHRHLSVIAIAAAFTGVLTLMPIARAVACSCALVPEAQAFAQSAVVFEGVVAGSRPGAGGEGLMDVAFTFAVEKTLKGGPLPERLVIASASNGAACGAGFGIRQRWRVFASNNNGTLHSGLCSSNRLIDERAPIPPLSNVADADTTVAQGLDLTIGVLMGVAIVALLALISVLAFRSTGRST